MYRELNRKRIILENRKPYSSDTTRLMAEMNLLDFAYTAMRLSGSSLTQKMVSEILQGVFFTEVSLKEHAKIERYKIVLAEMQSMCEMKNSLSPEITARLFRLLTGEEKAAFRKKTEITEEIAYLPPPASEIESRLTVLMNWIARDGEVYESANPFETEDLAEAPSNFILRAAYLHNRFIALCPYEKENLEMARVLMYYYLMYKGYPVFALNFSRQEYCDAISVYLKKGEIEPFYSGLSRSIFNKTEILMQLTAVE